jgi:hypothetical protein
VMLKTCQSCREKSGNWHLRKRRQAEAQGVYMRPISLLNHCTSWF